MNPDDDHDPAAPPEPWGHQIDIGEFLRDVIRLFSFIDAGKYASMIWRGTEHDPDEQLAKFRSIVDAHTRAEIPRLVIAIAATLRVKTDDGSWSVLDQNVGWVSSGAELDVEHGEPLSVREACNKIIHAKRVEPQYSSKEKGIRWLGGLVVLNGDRNGVPWCAEINLQEFCIAVADTDFYPHHPFPGNC